LRVARSARPFGERGTATKEQALCGRFARPLATGNLND